jgi:hypothetical protein
MESNDRQEVQKMIDEAMKKVASFQTRKLGDTPTDAYQLTPQKYVNMNGSVAGRPVGSVASIGQFYFSSNVNTPMWFNSNNQWVNGVGSVVALN